MIIYHYKWHPTHPCLRVIAALIGMESGSLLRAKERTRSNACTAIYRMRWTAGFQVGSRWDSQN